MIVTDSDVTAMATALAVFFVGQLEIQTAPFGATARTH
jgi:hypothetical protein